MSHNAHSRRILVVDDDESIRQFLCLVFERAGYEVTQAENGFKAMQVVVEAMPDLITLDVNMPFANGFTICRLLKQNQHTLHIPVLMLTTRGEAVAVEAGTAAGADDYALKPIEAASLLERVRYLLSLDQAELAQPKPASQQARPVTAAGASRELVAMIGGAGGLQAAQAVFAQMTRPPVCPVAILLQVPSFAARLHAAQFSSAGRLACQVGVEGTQMQPGIVYILPDEGEVLEISCSGAGFALTRPLHKHDADEHWVPPSRQDQFMASAGEAAGAKSVGVILSGTGTAGLSGLAQLKKTGGETYALELASAIVPNLPREALLQGAASAAIDVAAIAAMLTR